ncbi:hypothetical protein KDJ56_11020 [Brevibacillus composti]|uniref:Uncharacterized protein n=1 Tax=Brevibacillus composti TaxID=2796470 RepID=A0ABX7Z8I9_9BACL|nr:hypothetical protein [Brevibacillus composti]QUO43432.1 hypothetical protein KDJ56_11020 [Brevibacillus composti]
MQGKRLGDHALEILQKLNDAAATNFDEYTKTARSISDEDYGYLLHYLASMTTFVVTELDYRKRMNSTKLMQ